MNGVPRRLSTAAGAWSAVQARPYIIPDEVERACRRQLICLNQFALIAVSPKTAYPIKINPDRAPGKVASPPQLNHRTFSLITKSHIDAIFDAQMFTELSRVHDAQAR
jgi:hypothetical protein